MLLYPKRRVQWLERIYGQPPGVFAVAAAEDVPWPEELQQLAAEIGYDLDRHPLRRPFMEAVVEAVAADHMVRADEILTEMTGTELEWSDPDRVRAEQDHVRALGKLERVKDELRRDLERRRRQAVPSGATDDLAEAEAALAPARAAGTVPQGSRRQLLAIGRSLLGGEPGWYYGSDTMLCDAPRAEALGRAMAAAARTGAPQLVLHWDGEWPVVVRRIDGRGRITYRIEEEQVGPIEEEKHGTAEMERAGRAGDSEEDRHDAAPAPGPGVAG